MKEANKHCYEKTKRHQSHLPQNHETETGAQARTAYNVMGAGEQKQLGPPTRQSV